MAHGTAGQDQDILRSHLREGFHIRVRCLSFSGTQMSMRSFLARLIVSRERSAVATRVVSKSDPTPQTQEVSRARNFAARSCSARFPA